MYLTTKLFMAVAWFLIGAFIFLWAWTHPDRPGLTIWDTGISIGWVPLFLGVYNLVWWWIGRLNLRQRQAIEEAEARRMNEFHQRNRRPDEPDPNFDFSDQGAKSNDSKPIP